MHAEPAELEYDEIRDGVRKGNAIDGFYIVAQEQGRNANVNKKCDDHLEDAVGSDEENEPLIPVQPTPRKNQTLCTICRDMFVNGSKGLVSTQCGHTFHQSCLNAWFDSCQDEEKAKRCPNCNFDTVLNYQPHDPTWQLDDSQREIISSLEASRERLYRIEHSAGYSETSAMGYFDRMNIRSIEKDLRNRNIVRNGNEANDIDAANELENDSQAAAETNENVHASEPLDASGGASEPNDGGLDDSHAAAKTNDNWNDNERIDADDWDPSACANDELRLEMVVKASLQDEVEADEVDADDGEECKDDHPKSEM